MNDKTITPEQAEELYKHTKLSAFHNALQVQTALQEKRIDSAYIPGAIYEAGRREGIRAERASQKDGISDLLPELIRDMNIISINEATRKSSQALLKVFAEIREAAAAGGLPYDPISMLFAELASLLIAYSRD